MRRVVAAVLSALLLFTLAPGTASAAPPQESGGTCQLSSVVANDILTHATGLTTQTVKINAGCTPLTYTCVGNGWDQEWDQECFDLLYAKIEADAAWDTDKVKVNPNTGVIDTYVVPVTLDSFTARFTFANGTVGPALSATRTGTSTYTVSRNFGYASIHGLTKITVTATQGAQTFTKADTFYVRRNAGINGFNSGPEDRLVNSNLKSSGKVTRLTSSGTYVAWTNKRVDIEFRALNTSTWKSVGYDYTDSTGYFAKTVRTKGDGHWRARASQTSTQRGPISGADYVNVTNYANCSAVPYALRPLTRTEPGYEPRLDADSDGLACEV
jgi:hypothetical protein